MSPPSIEDLLDKSYWPDDGDALRATGPSAPLAPASIASLAAAARSALAKKKVGRLANALFVGFALDGAGFITHLKEKNTLRPSSFGLDVEPLRKALQKISHAIEDCGAAVVDFVETMYGLCITALKLGVWRSEVIAWLRLHRESGIKGVLATTELVFLRSSTGRRDFSKTSFDSGDPGFFSPEELAEGCSAVLALYFETFGALRYAPPISVGSFTNRNYIDVILFGAHLARFREWETLVNKFDYRVSLREEDGFHIFPPSVELQRSMAYGFMASEARPVFAAERWPQTGGNHLQDEVDAIPGVPPDQRGEIVGRPRRIRFQLPNSREILDVLWRGEAYEDEKFALMFASYSLMAEPDRIVRLVLDSTVTMAHILAVHRLAAFLKWFTAPRFLAHIDKEPELVAQSIVPHYTEEALKELLEPVLQTTNFTDLVKQLLTTKETANVDLQYQPIIKCDSGYLVCLNVLAGSNVIRNAMQVCKKRLFEDGKEDPPSEILVKLFADAGWIARGDLTHKWKGKVGQTDVLVLCGNQLFVFECKNSLLPTGAHELKTSFDYVRHARDQLDRFCEAIRSPEFRLLLGGKLGTPLPDDLKVTTGIVMTNRMFLGYRAGQHAVRGLHELGNFIESGMIGLAGHERCFWKGATLTAGDLVSYLDDDITFKPFWSSIRQAKHKFKIGDLTVFESVLEADMVALADRMGFPDLADRLSENARKAREDTKDGLG